MMNEQKTHEKYDVIIIGGGPAGLTAGIYSSRAGFKTCIIESGVIGGEAASTDLIENYPGFPDGTSGLKLTENMEKQAKKFGTEIIYDKVIKIEKTNQLQKGKYKILVTNSGKIQTKAVIVAVGTKPKLLNIPGEKKYKGRGVSYCATCDGFFYKDKKIAVIGCGNSGIQEGLFLLRFVKKIEFVEFLPKPTAEKVLLDKIKEYENVNFHLNSALQSINGDGKSATGITINDNTTLKVEEIEISGVFIYVGLNPNTEFLEGLVQRDKNGYIIIDKNQNTNVSGIFAAGDATIDTVKQIATAIGSGARAAINAGHYTENTN
ncbi:MAG: thioredoxin-disulfide reductase [Candidatus Cloacimonetes bacterium]|nr:thioredoxin-disulfide reductase [Candidatus Cloacimonadota bacterium]MBL7087008.1 thioredoxin-disulfide reductase [Candidatus Cloacimonadota bacterium]